MVPVVVVASGSFLVGPGQEKAISAKRFQLTFLEVEGDAFYLYVSQAGDKQSVILYLFISLLEIDSPWRYQFGLIQGNDYLYNGKKWYQLGDCRQQRFLW